LKDILFLQLLPFGLKSSAYIFTKLLRPLVAYWRRQSIKVVLYLDDGFGIAENNELCYEHAQVAKNDIVRSGLVPNKDKSIWKSSQTIEWLGFLWDLKLCILRVPEKKVL
jgi:predicted membrane chloride channel (bestrophin family)